MANRETFFFEEVLRKERLNSEFDNMESAAWSSLFDQGLSGVLFGGAVTASVSTPVLTVNPFVAVDGLGRRMILGAQTDFNFSLDYSGASTTPSSGQFRWLAVVLRYGKLGSVPVTDGDSATVYTVQTEGFSSTGDVTVDSGSANFGKLRIIAGTQAGDTVSANRPSVSYPDIILCDLLIDDTGLVHLAPQGGISQSRTSFGPTIRQAALLSNFNRDTTKYVLLENTDLFDDAIQLRRFVHRDQDADPTIVFTINAAWDPIANQWNADQPTHAAMSVELGANGISINTQNRGASSWTDHRHDTAGWDGRTKLLANIQNGDVSIDGGGRIVGNGAQTAYAAVGGPSDAAVTSMKVGFTWPQRMAAVPSSVTLSSGLASDANVVGGSAGASFSDVGGELVFTVTTLGQHVYCGRALTSVP